VVHVNALASLDPFSIWAGIVIGGVVVILLMASPWGHDGGPQSYGSWFGAWVGGIGPLFGLVAALAVWLLS
jgi:hypothetical protein